MPLPPDNDLEREIEVLFESVREEAARPNSIGVTTFKSARLQALSVRALVVQLERNALAQEKTDRAMERLTRTGIGLAVVATILGAVQVVLAVLN
jgi:3-methyladenine DNA glycosylase/8-oxoguanine DNA glycosylase